jgi:hypothetical protein
MSSKLQFGFKAKSSIIMSSMALKESIAYYTERIRFYFLYFLYATKASDQVKHGKLFNFLIWRKLPALVIRVLINFHSRNFMCVSWYCVASDYLQSILWSQTGRGFKPCSILSVYRRHAESLI